MSKRSVLLDTYKIMVDTHVLSIMEISVLCCDVFCLQFLAFKIFVVKIRHLENLCQLNVMAFELFCLVDVHL